MKVISRLVLFLFASRRGIYDIYLLQLRRKGRRERESCGEREGGRKRENIYAFKFMKSVPNFSCSTLYTSRACESYMRGMVGKSSGIPLTQ